MQALEVISAIIAETLIELGVMILTEPPEIHWPNGLVSKLPQGGKAKKGKKVQKTRHGIYGELVCSLAPSVPVQNKNTGIDNSKKVTKGFKTPVKKNANCTDVQVLQVETEGDKNNDQESANGAGLHQGLPVQGRCCKLSWY